MTQTPLYRRVPAHINDVTGRFCSTAGTVAPLGICPNGCDHAAHYANDGHPGCDDPMMDTSNCTCVMSCADDPATACSLSGEFHVHPDDGSGTFGPCPVHPDALGDY